MSIAPASWRVHLRRDTPLRELLRALYRHRDAVLAYYPHVPLTKERTPVGALILLWERWDYVRGHCPKCRSVVLGVSFGGLLSCGSVTGCCLGCARLVSRFIGGAGPIQSAIHKFLHDTPYRLTLTAQLPPPADAGEFTYGGWGWSLPRKLPELEAVLQELDGGA